MYIRSHLIKTIHAGSHKLHVSAIKYVSAHEQALSLHDIEGLLTEDELYIYKRGRNAKPASVPKNADVGEYRTATGFEAVLGFLYVTSQYSRIDAIMQNVIAAKEKQDKPRKNNLEEEEVNVTISKE